MKPKSALRSFLSIASSAVLSISYTHAATLYWDGTTSTANADGGNGTWDNGTTSNWDTAAFGGANSFWTNANNDTAVFGGGGTANRTVTLGEDITVGGLQFDARTYTITTGVNTLTFGGTDNLILFGGNRDTTAANITGTVAGSGNLILSQRVFPLTSTLTFSGISAGGWSGTTTINAGTILVTNSTSGNLNQVLNNTSGITLNGGGTLRLNRATNANINAISDSAAITVNGGGTFFVQSADAGGASAIENIGAVTVNSGQMNFVFGNNASSGQRVVMSSLTRAGSTSALTFSGNSLSTSNKFIVTGAGTTAAGEIIGAWATTGPQNGVNIQTDYAVFNSNEVHAANIAGSAQSTWSTTHAATSNYTLANAAGSVSDGVLSATRNINTLRNATTAAPATANSADNFFTLAGNSFANDDLITVSGTGNTVAGTAYYVIDKDVFGANTFRISTTPGGSVLNLSNTTAGQISGGLNLNGNTLGTYGILNGTVNANSGFAIAGGGSITLPTTTSGNLHVTTSASAMTIASPITDNGAGVLSLVKNGNNILTLSGANTYTGDLVINAGTVTLSNVGAWGPTGKNVIFDGSGTLRPLGTYTGGVLTVSEGVVGTIGRGVSGSPATTFASTTGSGKLIFQGTGNAAIGLNLGDASGFTGSIQADVSFGSNPRPLVIFSGLADTAGSALQSGGGQGDSNQGTFFRYQGTSQLTFNNRIIEFLPRSGGNSSLRDMTLENNSANAAHTWVINTDVVNNNDRTNNLGTLILAGTNTGDNELAGQYGDSTYNNQSFRLSKQGNGKWIVSNVANTYSGITSVTGGTLEIKKLADGGEASSIGTSSNAASNLTLSNNTTLRYTGAGDSSDRSFTIAGSSAGHQATLNASGTGALNLTSTSTPGYGTTNQTRTLNLRGTNTDANTLAATIANNGTGAVSVVKNDGGTWVLSSTNTYTGTTTVSGGTLIINGNSSTATGAVTVAAAGTLGGIGTVGGNTTIDGFLSPGQSPGTLTFAGNLTLNNNSTYLFEGGDLTDVGGTLVLNNTWNLTLGTGFQDGGSVTLFEYFDLGTANLTPNINDLGLGFTPSGALTLTDTGSSIVLNGISVIPEPGAALLGGLGLLMLLRRRR